MSTIDVTALPDGKSIEIKVDGKSNVYKVSETEEHNCAACALENEVACNYVSCCAGKIEHGVIASFRVSRAVVNASKLASIAWIKVED